MIENLRNCEVCGKIGVMRYIDCGDNILRCEECAVEEYKKYYGDGKRHCECNSQHAFGLNFPHDKFCPMSWDEE